MPYEIVYHDKEPEQPKVGDMWPSPDWAKSNVISKRYLEQEASKRPPLMVMLPSKHDPNHGDWFLIDRAASGDKSRKGWEVTIVGELVPGQKPDITLKPSINCEGSYHGYIRNGVITDDVEGRSYGHPSIRPKDRRAADDKKRS